MKQISGERLQDHWSSGFIALTLDFVVSFIFFLLKYMNFNISICLLILKVCFLILYKHKLIILVVVPLVYKYKNKLYKTYFPKLYV